MHSNDRFDLATIVLKRKSHTAKSSKEIIDDRWLMKPWLVEATSISAFPHSQVVASKTDLEVVSLLNKLR